MGNDNFTGGSTPMQPPGEEPVVPNPDADDLQPGDTVVLNYAHAESRRTCPIGLIIAIDGDAAHVRWQNHRKPEGRYALAGLIAVKAG